MTTRSRLFTCLCLLAFLAFLALQILASSQKSFWEDEAFTAASVQRPIPELLAHPEDIDAYKPPLYFLAAAAWGAIFGYEELPLSSLSILFSGLAFVLIVVLSNRIGEARSALFTAALLALSPLMLSYAHSVRYYSLAMLLVLCNLSIVLALNTSFRIWVLGGYMLVNIAQFYTIYTLVPVTLTCFAWLGIALARQRRWQLLALWVAAHAIVALGCLPWLGIMLQGANTWTSSAQVSSQNFRSMLLAVVSRLAYVIIAFTAGETLVPTHLWALIALAISMVAVSVGGWTLWRQRSAAGFLLGGVLITNVVVGVLINIAGVYPDNSPAALSRRIFFVYPVFLLLAGIGLSSMRKLIAMCALLALSVCHIVAMRNYFTGQQFLQPIQAVPWREIMLSIQREARSETIVICSAGDSSCTYFVQRFGLPQGNVQTILAAPQASGDVWWIQTNIGSDQHYDRSAEAVQLDALKQRFDAIDSTNYVLHDSAIRALKRRLTGRTDYEYRVNVLHLREPKR